MRARFLALLFFFSLGSAGPAYADDIVVLGDSHNGALGPRAVRYLHQQGHRARSIHRNGWSVSTYRARGLPRIGDADMAVVILGGNNRTRSYSHYRSDVLWLLQSLRSQGVRKVIWVGPFWCTRDDLRERHRQTRGFQQVLFDDLGIEWHDLYESTRHFRMASDEVHFTRESYKDIFEQLIVPILPP